MVEREFGIEPFAMPRGVFPRCRRLVCIRGTYRSHQAHR